MSLRNLNWAREMLEIEFWHGRKKNMDFEVRDTWVEMLTLPLMNV